MIDEQLVQAAFDDFRRVDGIHAAQLERAVEESIRSFGKPLTVQDIVRWLIWIELRSRAHLRWIKTLITMNAILVIVILLHIILPHDFFRGEASKILAYALGRQGTPVVAVFDTTPPPLPAEITGGGPKGNGTLLPLENLVVVLTTNNPNVNTTNVRKRYYEVVDLSERFGYDPAFTLAIWVAESGASNYRLFPDVADFGCTRTPRENFDSQIDCFLSLWGKYFTEEQYSSCRGGDNTLSNREFLLIFYQGPQRCPEKEFVPNPEYPERIRKIYSLVTGGGDIDFSGVR